MSTYNFVQPTFTTQYGTQLLGFYVTWGTTASDTSAVSTAVGSPDEIKMSIKLNVATVGLSTATGEKLDSATPATHTFDWYISMMNGDIYKESDPSTYTAMAFDHAIGHLEMVVAAGTPDTLVVTWVDASSI